MNPPPSPCRGPMSRREFMRVGAMGAGGLSLADLFRLRAAAGGAAELKPAGRRSDTAVIMLWLAGGPSHLETYDLKPAAPREIRGEFEPIATNVAGLEICEHLPLQAKIADKLAVIRSIEPGYQDHGPGTWRFLSGRMQPVSASDGPAQFPEIGSIVAWARRDERRSLPQFIAQPRTFHEGHAYLGQAFAPFAIGKYPDEPDSNLANMSLAPQLAARLDDRRALLRAFDRMRRDLDVEGNMDAMDQFHRQAVDLLASPEVRKAFDLTQESPQTLARYGDHFWCRSALLARRLAEAGCGLVHINLLSSRRNGMSAGFADNWDDHSQEVRGNIFEAMRGRLPVLDRTVATLVEDIYDRGLEKKIMVVVAGEFGRTPRIVTTSGRPGREHWGGAMSVVVAGGGLKTGQVIGSTTARGERPDHRRLDPNDLLATIYRFLGVDTQREIHLPTGRPLPILPWGEPIRELIG